MIHIIGVDPGPCTGIAILHWDSTAAAGAYTWHGYQCDAGSARSLLEMLLNQWDGEWTAGEIEHFVHGNLPNSPTTVRLENELAETAEDCGLKLARCPMATVKPWATDKRMTAAGAWATIPAKMVDARAASRHCLYRAVNGGGVPDPLSRKGKVAA